MLSEIWLDRGELSEICLVPVSELCRYPQKSESVVNLPTPHLNIPFLPKEFIFTSSAKESFSIFCVRGGRGVQHFSSPGQTGTPAQFPISCQFRWLPSTSRPFPPSPFAPPPLFFETFLFGLPFVSRKKKKIYIVGRGEEEEEKRVFNWITSPPLLSSRHLTHDKSI